MKIFPFVLAGLLLAGTALAKPPYIPVGPKPLLDAMPRPADWKMTESAAATTYVGSLVTTGRRSFERKIEVDGEEQEFTIEITVTDTGGEAPELSELKEMPELKRPNLIVSQKGGQPLMIILDDSSANVFRTALYDRFVINVETNLPNDQALQYVSATNYPKLKSAPEKSLPKGFRKFQAISYNELDPTKNVAFEESFETVEDIELENANMAEELGIETAAEEEVELEKAIAEEEARAAAAEASGVREPEDDSSDDDAAE